ncbi:MAG: hypothetical protein AAFY72_07380 [Cyanobacteria bacterium J06649_4]
MKVRALLQCVVWGMVIGIGADSLIPNSYFLERSAEAVVLEVPESFEEPSESEEEIRPEEILPEEIRPEGSESEPEESSEQESVEPRPYAPLRSSPIACPDDVETLSALMMRDLPNYTNRVLQRTVAVLPWTEADEQRRANGEFVREPYRPSHVLIAGGVDLTPLDLSEYTFTTSPEAGGPLTQLFFTTLSRHYSGLSIDQVQEYHWLFLTRTVEGWRLAFMFSSVDDIDDVRPKLPPMESSRSSVGQAVQIWLRDCRFGVIEAL